MPVDPPALVEVGTEEPPPDVVMLLPPDVWLTGLEVTTVPFVLPCPGWLVAVVDDGRLVTLELSVTGLELIWPCEDSVADTEPV